MESSLNVDISLFDSFLNIFFEKKKKEVNFILHSQIEVALFLIQK